MPKFPAEGGSTTRELIQWERSAMVLDLYKRGMTMRATAEELNCTESQVGNDIRSYIDELRRMGLQSAAQYRQVQLERIQDSVRAIWPMVLAGRMEAINTLIKLMEREARLLGLDAPTKVDLTAKIRALAEAEGQNPDEALDIADAVYREVIEA